MSTGRGAPLVSRVAVALAGVAVGAGAVVAGYRYAAPVTAAVGGAMTLAALDVAARHRRAHLSAALVLDIVEALLGECRGRPPANVHTLTLELVQRVRRDERAARSDRDRAGRVTDRYALAASANGA